MSFDDILTNSEFIPLSEMLEFIVDNRGKTVPTSESGIPLIATNCIKNTELFPIYDKVRYVSQETYDNWFRAHPEPGDIIFVNKGKPGSVAIVPDPVDFCIAQDMMAFRVNQDIIYNKYLFAVLRSSKIQNRIMNMHVGTMIPHFKKGDLDKVMIPVPSKRIQKFIGDLYYRISYKIEVNNQINDTLENMAQELFKRWFVDFEFPDENGEPYQSSGGEMIDSVSGKIPRGWDYGNLDEIADYLNGIAMQKYRPEDNEDSFPVLKIKELRQGFTDENSDRCSSKIDSKYIIKDGDVIFSWSGTLLVNIWSGGKSGLNQHLFKVTSSNYDSWFYYYWTKYHLNKFIHIAKSKATTMGHIKRRDLSDSKVLIPSDEIYKAASEIFNPIFRKLVVTKIESKRLKQIRDTILPKLMSGELRVPLEETEEVTARMKGG